jgi:hypothetical protein
MATKKNIKKDPIKAKNTWTIQEFQIWLNSAISLQGDEWIPNKEQWETILDIIYKLQDVAPVAPKGTQYRAGMQAPVMVPPQYNNLPNGSIPDISAPPEASLPLSKLNELNKSGKLSGNQVPIQESGEYKSSFV